MHLPGKITYKEIDEMIATVDKNKDGKISFSEFRVEYTSLYYSVLTRASNFREDFEKALGCYKTLC